MGKDKNWHFVADVCLYVGIGIVVMAYAIGFGGVVIEWLFERMMSLSWQTIYLPIGLLLATIGILVKLILTRRKIRKGYRIKAWDEMNNPDGRYPFSDARLKFIKDERG